MKNVLILLAGFPATGKSYLMNIILKKYPEMKTVSLDDIKEELWDSVGFDNMEEKNNLDAMARGTFYQQLGLMMRNKEDVISDYPFSEKQKEIISNLAADYHYQIITIRLIGDLETLYQRSLIRDLDPKRHLGHLVSSYHKGDTCTDRRYADSLVDRETFFERCTNRGYDQFSLGSLYEVDVSDFNKVNYPKVMDFLDKEIGKDH